MSRLVDVGANTMHLIWYVQVKQEAKASDIRLEEHVVTSDIWNPKLFMASWHIACIYGGIKIIGKNRPIDTSTTSNIEMFNGNMGLQLTTFHLKMKAKSTPHPTPNREEKRRGK